MEYPGKKDKLNVNIKSENFHRKIVLNDLNKFPLIWFLYYMRTSN